MRSPRSATTSCPPGSTSTPAPSVSRSCPRPADRPPYDLPSPPSSSLEVLRAQVPPAPPDRQAPPAAPRHPLPTAPAPASRYLEPVMPRTRKRRRETLRVPRSAALLPEYDRGTVPEGLVTRRVLRDMGLSPGDNDGPVAILRCRRCATRPNWSCRHPTRGFLLRVDLARPKRVPTLGQELALDRAMAARPPVLGSGQLDHLRGSMPATQHRREDGVSHWRSCLAASEQSQSSLAPM
ncbi:RRQRL motif-containing zinc-binding protein [Streptomyces rubiginosohelvolus]|uniref:RRQRL motif-containing zinc-binding protein n=1 Tax=Streptomyces rubiginosohelvolus TaxID=67362 RepID=UPI003695B6BD